MTYSKSDKLAGMVVFLACVSAITGYSASNIIHDTPAKIQSRDLNGNGIPDKFYTIEGKVAVVEIDGEPILNFLKKR
jgi:hypothetical protein